MPDQVRVKVIQADGSEEESWILPGRTVHQVLEMLGFDSGGTCAGMGNCGKCKIRVEGQVNKMDAKEQTFLMPEEIKNGERLACYCTIQGDATIYLDLLPSEYSHKSRLLKFIKMRDIQPGVESKTFFISGRQKESVIPLYDRIQAVLPSYSLKLNMKNLNELNKIDRPGRPTLELHAILFDEKEVCLVEKERSRILGLALDLGTTSLFTALLDLETGKVLAMASQSNMQRIYGQDIISRVSYAAENRDGAETLHKILINNINAMIDDMINQTGLPADRIFKLSVVGNPVMLHFFLGLETAGFSAAPYNGLFSSELHFSDERFGLNINPLAKIAILPQIGGFVGADTIACLITLSKNMNTAFLLCDIGTNGEIVVCKKGKMWACSAAAGPALEGGALSSGMRAGCGAIERFKMVEGSIQNDVIGGGFPKGICGSAIVDLIAILLENHCLSEEGNFTPLINEYFPLRTGGRGEEIIIAGEDSSGDTPIVLNQEDIRQIQLAKGAIRTAIDVLLKEAGLQTVDLDKVYMAGVFGSYLDAGSLVKIGLLPEIGREKVINIGNAAANGCMMALMSVNQMKEAAKIKQKVQYIELANQPDFQERFLKNLLFKPVNG